MTDLAIDRLQLQILNASGHEHRVHGIATRAAALVGNRLGTLANGLPAGTSRTADALAVAPVTLDFARTDDETCAQQLADSIMNAVRIQVEG